METNGHGVNGAAKGLNGTGAFLKSEVGKQLKARLDQAKGRSGAPPGEGEIDPSNVVKRGPGRPPKVQAEAPAQEPKRRGRPPKVSYEDLKEPVRDGEVPETVEQISIPALQIKLATLTVKSITPLIVHKFSEKSRREIEQKQQGAGKHKKDPKVPEDEYQGCFYFTPDGKYGIPASAFKKAMVSACRYADMKMSAAKGAFHILGDLLPINGSKPWMRTDICRVGNFGSKVADVRYRPQFDEWSVKITFRYNSAAISLSQLANLINISGFAVGVCEWRPEKDGSFGMFEVANLDEDGEGKARGRKGK